MNYSDEISKLAKLAATQRDNGRVDPVTEEIIEGLLTLVKNLASDYEDLNERLKQNEEFSETLSMDLFDVQSLVLKKSGLENENDDLTGVDLAQLFAQLNEDDEDDDEHDHCDCGCGHHHDHDDYDDDDFDGDSGSEAVRCPFCNTFIFASSNTKNFQCPFCNGTFTREDLI